MTHCPTIINQSEHTIVVFQERGILFNKQVLQPGEAVNISRFQTGSFILPYYIHAVIGDERNLPNRQQSLKNLVSVAVIPTAFLVGALAAAMTAGVLTGPSLALAPLVSGMIVQGVVIDAAAIAAGTLLATRAVLVSEMLVKKYPENFMCKSKRLMPGKRFVVITGGLQSPLVMDTSVKERVVKKLRISTVKEPNDTMLDQIQYYTGMGRKDCKKEKRNDPEALLET